MAQTFLDFDSIAPDTTESRVQQHIDSIRSLLDTFVSNETMGASDANALITRLELAQYELGQVWNPASHLHAVADSPEWRAVYGRSRQALSALHTEIFQNRGLFDVAKLARQAASDLDPSRVRALDHMLRDLRLNGVDLDESAQARFAELQQRLSALATRFSENVLDATESWSHHVEDAGELAGLPENIVEQANAKAQRAGLEGWLLGLDFPSYFSVMAHARSRGLRRVVYRAYVTRASELGEHDADLDNTSVIDEIMQTRQELAALLGFPSYAHYSLEKKAATSPEDVLAFLGDLAARSHPVAQREYDELVTFARQDLGIDSLEPWDITFAAERLKESTHAISEEQLREYFPLDHVLEGLFGLARQLFAIEFAPITSFSTYDPQLKLFAVLDDDEQPVAYFYADLFARTGKRSGAWMGTCQDRCELGNVKELPVAFLSCNFAPPRRISANDSSTSEDQDQVATLSHTEVLTLFHEFGHTLHHCLTRITEPSVAGINGVPWDMVELPSQLMENWCWNPATLRQLSQHIESRDPLPEEMIERLSKLRTFHAGMQMVRQLEFALFDFRLHLEYDAQTPNFAQRLIEEVRAEVAVVDAPEYNRFQNSFSHIFAGGYAAGYYSYKWAEVLSSDAFERFEETDILDRDSGRDFRTLVLEVGGSVDLLEQFEAFRGRAPRVDALLRHDGIA
jgi:oligopeptidase A